MDLRMIYGYVIGRLYYAVQGLWRFVRVPKTAKHTDIINDISERLGVSREEAIRQVRRAWLLQGMEGYKENDNEQTELNKQEQKCQ